MNGLPFTGPPLWIDWFDQSRYHSSAMAFAHAQLTEAKHCYPLLYPLLAAPFVRLTPSDPFLVLDLLLYLIAFRGFQFIAARVGISETVAAICFALATLVDPSVARSWVDPWTTTLSAAIFYWLIELTLRCSDSSLDRKPLALGAAIGVLAAAAPLVRPVDAITSLTCLGIIGIVCFKHIPRRRTLLLAIIGAGTLVVMAYAGLHFAIYGLRPTPYMVAAADTGFAWSDIAWKAYVLLIHADPWFPGSISIFERLPWLLLGLSGLAIAFLRGSFRVRATVLVIAASVLPNTVVMLTYADLQPPGLWKFGNIHYFKWTLPLIALGIPLSWRAFKARSSRKPLLIAFTAFSSLILLRVEPVSVGPNEPARMIAFRGDVTGDWAEAYFAKVQVTDTVGTLDNISGFHQIPDRMGQRAIAVKRLFEGNEKRADPGEHPGMPTGPYARYAGRLTILGF